MQTTEGLRRLNIGRTVGGLGLIVLGAVFLLDRAGYVDAGTIVSDWWPVVIIVIGLLQIAANPKALIGPGIVIAVGFILLLATTDVLPTSAGALFWPLVLIAVGAFLLLTRGARAGRESEFEERVNSFVIFGGNELVSRSEWFRGGWLGAFFGAITLDLREAKLGPGGATIDAIAAFGGIDILVPRGWKVSISGLPIFGGYEDKTKVDSPLPFDAPTLNVNVIALFGGVDVKHEK